MKLSDFLQQEADTSSGDFEAKYRHGFLLINKEPANGEFERDTGFHTRDAEQARKMLIRAQDEAELHLVGGGARRASRVTVGRTANTGVALKHPSISKFHAYFRIERDGSCVLCDPGSKNGTTVNGVRLQKDGEVALKGGETIVFGGSYEGTFHTATTLFRHMTMLRRWSGVS
jgi:hypothetical protein